MSDARPITNITDFVCGSCWNGFSRNDPGVLLGDQLVCPHCGTPVPSGDPDEQLANAVRNAPRMSERDSSEFQAHSFRDTSEFAPTAENTADATAGKVWLPPDQRAGRTAADSDDFGHGVIVGDPEHELSDAERTLSGAQENDALLAAVRQTSPIPKAFVVGEELSIVTDEPTPVDIAAMTEMDEAAALADSLAASLPEADLAHRDWKLKAMGITYNFHGLDPLFSWAANKSGQPMSLSYDGEIWKDFHSFYTSIRDGVAVKKAFDRAPDPSNAPPPPSTPRVTRTINQIRPELPELEGLRPPAEATPKDLASMRAPSTSGQLVNRVVTNPANPGGRGGATTSNAALQGSTQASSTAIRAATTGKASLAPATSPSKRMPVAAIEQKPLLTPLRIAAIAIVVVLVALAALHFTGVVRIPGLR